MGFWDLKTLKLDEFRPGIWSKVESGKNLTMAFMEIAPNKEGVAHDHAFRSVWNCDRRRDRDVCG